MSLSVSDFNNRIIKTEKEIDVLQEKINKKKKEIANLKKQKHVQELKERTPMENNAYLNQFLRQA